MAKEVDMSHSKGAERFEIAGIGVDNLSEAQTLGRIQCLIESGGHHYGAVVNAAKVSLARKDRELMRILKSADLVTADGMSVVWASRLLGHRLKERVTGIDLLESLIGHAARCGDPVYFLGARQDSVRGLIERLASEFPSLRVAGWRDGYFTSAENDAVVEGIRR